MADPSLAKGRLHLIAMTMFGIAASVLLFGVGLHLERLRSRTHFQHVAEQRFNTLQANVAASLDTIRLLAGHFEAVGHRGTSRSSYSTLVAPALADNRHLKALSWAAAGPAGVPRA